MDSGGHWNMLTRILYKHKSWHYSIGNCVSVQGSLGFLSANNGLSNQWQSVLLFCVRSVAFVYNNNNNNIQCWHILSWNIFDLTWRVGSVHNIILYIKRSQMSPRAGSQHDYTSINLRHIFILERKFWSTTMLFRRILVSSYATPDFIKLFCFSHIKSKY